MARDKELYTREEGEAWRPIDEIGRRVGEDLNVGISARADAQHPYSSKRNYFEWWYFDADLEDGHHLLLELQVPNLLRPWKKQCCMLFHINTPNGEKNDLFDRYPIVQCCQTVS